MHPIITTPTTAVHRPRNVNHDQKMMLDRKPPPKNLRLIRQNATMTSEGNNETTRKSNSSSRLGSNLAGVWEDFLFSTEKSHGASSDLGDSNSKIRKDAGDFSSNEEDIMASRGSSTTATTAKRAYLSTGKIYFQALSLRSSSNNYGDYEYVDFTMESSSGFFEPDESAGSLKL